MNSSSTTHISRHSIARRMGAAVLLALGSCVIAEAATLTDSFAGRPFVTGYTATLTGDTKSAGPEVGEPAHYEKGDNALRSVWASWTAPENGEVTINTSGSSFNTVIAVYVGSNLTELKPVALNNNVQDDFTWSSVTFPAKAETTYAIAVDGAVNNASGRGSAVLNIQFTPKVQPGSEPGSDTFAGRGRLEGYNAAGVANNSHFTTEFGEPDHGSSHDQTAWWQWTAPADGPVEIRTEGSDFRTFLAVYNGHDLARLIRVASNGEQPNVGWSRVRFTAQRGVTYQIAVDGRFNNALGQGNVRLLVNQAVAPQDTLELYKAVEVEIPGLLNVTYQLQSSMDLMLWENVGNPMVGEGKPIRVLQSTRESGNRFYRYVAQ